MSNTPHSFVGDIQELRNRVSQEIDRGPVTPSYELDADQSCAILNAALATEIVCWLRYKSHALIASGLNSESVIEEFEQHATEELNHANQIATRIAQLGGRPDLNPSGLAERAHSQYDESRELVAMIREDLIAERIAIETYRDMVRFFGDKDPTSRRMMEEILAKEEEHADDLAHLLTRLAPAA